MSIVTLTQFKQHLRELSDDLDDPFQLALNAAEAEANAFVGFDIDEEFGDDEPPSDIVMAAMLLAQIHADGGAVNDNEYRRAAAQGLLRPYRRDTGMRAA